MGQFDNVSYIVEIKKRMKRLGINLDLFIDEITNHWSDPRGFNFLAGYAKTQNLEMQLLLNKRFAIDHPLSKRIRGSRAYREVSQTDGIHLTMAPGKPYNEYPRSVKWHLNIHIDSISMCPAPNQLPGRNRQICSFGAPNDDAIATVKRIVGHIRKDLLHK